MQSIRAAAVVVSAVVSTALTIAHPGPADAITGPPAATQGEWVWPLQPQPVVVRGFEPPAHRWDAGHRGVDLAGSPLQPVLAMRDGVVAFARPVAGRGVVVVVHGGLRSTYEPVTSSVHTGQTVAAGQVIGLLQSTHSHCPPESCLHVGLRRGAEYLDPLSVLGPRDVHLKPLAGGPHEGSSRVSDTLPSQMEPTQQGDLARSALSLHERSPHERSPHARSPDETSPHPWEAWTAGLVAAALGLAASPSLVGRRRRRHEAA